MLYHLRFPWGKNSGAPCARGCMGPGPICTGVGKKKKSLTSTAVRTLDRPVAVQSALSRLPPVIVSSHNFYFSNAVFSKCNFHYVCLY